MRIRSYHSDDCQAILSLFYETVHRINRRDYTQEQIEAWANNNKIDPIGSRNERYYCWLW